MKKNILILSIALFWAMTSKAQIFMGTTKSDILSYFKKEYPNSEYKGDEITVENTKMNIVIPGNSIDEKVMWTFFLNDKNECYKTITVMNKNRILECKSVFDHGYKKLTNYIWINKEKTALINLQTASEGPAFALVIVSI